MNDELDRFRRVWNAVRTKYDSGYIVYERGLQAALHTALCEMFEFLPESGIVVEPHWDNQIPDMVIVQSREITDIFELKFAPHWWPQFQADTDKLLAYKGSQHVTLDPSTGEWDEPSPIRTDCRLHFVVVGQHNAAAVDPRNLPDRIFLWYGRIDGDKSKWGVCRGEAAQ